MENIDFLIIIFLKMQKVVILVGIFLIYKLILNNKKTLLPNINLIKNIGYNYNPEGKGAKKFRNLKI